MLTVEKNVCMADPGDNDFVGPQPDSNPQLPDELTLLRQALQEQGKHVGQLEQQIELLNKEVGMLSEKLKRTRDELKELRADYEKTTSKPK